MTGIFLSETGSWWYDVERSVHERVCVIWDTPEESSPAFGPLVGACQVIRNHRDTSNPHYGPQPFCSLADTKRVILIRVKLKLVQEMTGTCPEVSQYSIWNEVPPSSRHGLQQGIYT